MDRVAKFLYWIWGAIKISYLAEQMIRLAGKEPGKDIKIEYTGLRLVRNYLKNCFMNQNN